MPSINCEINLILTWSVNCYIVAGTVANQVPKFAITNKKRYVTVAALSAQDNVKLLKQINSGFKED